MGGWYISFLCPGLPTCLVAPILSSTYSFKPNHAIPTPPCPISRSDCTGDMLCNNATGRTCTRYTCDPTTGATLSSPCQGFCTVCAVREMEGRAQSLLLLLLPPLLLLPHTSYVMCCWMHKLIPCLSQALLRVPSSPHRPAPAPADWQRLLPPLRPAHQRRPAADAGIRRRRVPHLVAAAVSGEG